MEQTIHSESGDIREGSTTSAIDKVSAKIPSIAFLALAGGAIAASLALATSKRNKDLANFVGLWVPSLLLLGIYNKIVKVAGSDRGERMIH